MNDVLEPDENLEERLQHRKIEAVDAINEAMRPRRFLTVGSRGSDRWLAKILMVLAFAMLVFIVLTSFRQDQSTRALGDADVDRARILSTLQVQTKLLEEQNHDLLCFADSTQSFEGTVAQYLLLQRQLQPDDPRVQQVLVDLRALQDRLQQAKTLCFTGTLPR